MKPSDDAIALLDRDQLYAGMFRLHLRHELFHVQHELERGREPKGVSDTVRIEGAARIAVARVLQLFPVDAQLRLESLRSPLMQELIDDVKSLASSRLHVRRDVASATPESRRAR